MSITKRATQWLSRRTLLAGLGLATAGAAVHAGMNSRGAAAADSAGTEADRWMAKAEIAELRRRYALATDLIGLNTDEGIEAGRAIYDGGPDVCLPTDSELLACNDDFCSLQSQVTFNAVINTTYLIRLGTFTEEKSSGMRRDGPSALEEAAVDELKALYSDSLAALDAYGASLSPSPAE